MHMKNTSSVFECYLSMAGRLSHPVLGQLLRLLLPIKLLGGVILGL